MLFATGKMNLTGGKSEYDCKVTARKMEKILKDELKLNLGAVKVALKLTNVVGTVSCGFPIRLEGLALKHISYSTVSYASLSLSKYIYNISVFVILQPLTNITPAV